MKIERRLSTTLRADVGEDAAPMLVGRAAPYNTETTIGGMFREKIAQGAFTRAIRERHDCVMTYNHDENQILGRTTSGTLRLAEDSQGLNFRCVLPDTTLARDLHALVKRGDISECSFAFSVLDDDWDEGDPKADEDDDRRLPCRTLKDVHLYDCSAVVRPAYGSGTHVSARAIGELFPFGAGYGFPAEVRAAINSSTSDAGFEGRLARAQAILAGITSDRVKHAQQVVADAKRQAHRMPTQEEHAERMRVLRSDTPEGRRLRALAARTEAELQSRK